VRIHLDPFAIALFGFVTSAWIDKKTTNFLTALLLAGPSHTSALSTLATPLIPGA